MTGFTGILNTPLLSRWPFIDEYILPGTGYIEGFDATADSATISITSASQTLYDLSIVYSAPYGTKATTVVLNGAGGSQISLEETTSWTTVSAGQVLLNAGTNTISIQSNWGW